jgi:hypothetical protein
MPRRTTMPLWHVPTSGPSGPHSADELLQSKPELQPWADLLTRLTDARAHELAALNQLREAAFIALEVVTPGALTSWIEGVTSDIAHVFESLENGVGVMDRHLARKLGDVGLTNAVLQAMPQAGFPENAGQFPAFTQSPGMVTKDKTR